MVEFNFISLWCGVCLFMLSVFVYMYCCLDLLHTDKWSAFLLFGIFGFVRDFPGESIVIFLYISKLHMILRKNYDDKGAMENSISCDLK